MGDAQRRDRARTSDSGGENADDLRALVALDVLDADLAALVWLLAERGVPVSVVSLDRHAAEHVRRALVGQVLAQQPTRDAVAGGIVLASSLADVLRMMGGGGEIVDEARDLGVVLVVDEQRVQVAHYVRPVERDGAGHVQRRPPAVLAARDRASGVLDHFDWGFSDELAARAGIERDEFEREHAARARRLSGLDSGVGAPNARH